MARIDINNPAVQEACFHFLRFHVGLGSRQEHESFAREVLLAATQFMFRTEDGPTNHATNATRSERENSAS